jgi:phosphatidylglycerol:prolipoprotein diacylglycerol transferase
VIDLPFDPDIVLFGARVLSWHSFFAIVGMLFGVALALRLLRTRVPLQRAYAIAAWAVGVGFVGARLLHVAEEWEVFVADPARVLAVWDGGSSILGAVIGGYATIAVASWRMGVPVGFVLDAAACAAGFGMGIGRIGDIVNGEHHAVACAELPWCVRYTHPATLGQRDYVHPAVAYEMLLDFGISALLLWLRPGLVGKVPEGRLLWLFLLLYSAGRFFISFLRLDPLVFAGLREAQLVSLLLVAIAAPMLLYLAAQRRRVLARRSPAG